MFQNLVQSVVDAFALAWDVGATAGELVQQWGVNYTMRLRRAIYTLIALPILIIVIGVILNTSWITALAGLAAGFFALRIISIEALPLLIAGAVLGRGTPQNRILEVGERFVRSAAWVLMVEHFIALVACIVPLQDNWRAVPAIILASVTLLFSKLAWQDETVLLRRVVKVTSLVTIGIGILSCVMPEPTQAIADKRTPFNRWMARGIKCWQPWERNVPKECTPDPPTQTAPATTSTGTSASGPQPCDDGGVVELDFKTKPKVDIVLQTDCLSQAVALPSGATWRIHTPGGPDDLWEYFFWNGERSLAQDGGWRKPSIAYSRFRLRATKQNTTATISVEPS